MDNKFKFYGVWALKILAAAAFLMAGFSKLTGAEMMVGVFEQVGVGQWFRYVAGAIEVVGAVVLFVPGKAVFGAALLTATMIGAVITHLFVIGGSAVPALVLLTITATIAWSHRAQLPARA